MTRSGFAQLEDVIRDPDFPDLDLALRRGRHVDRDDVAWYALLGDAQDHLEAFYSRYGCELIHKADGYYYLLPTGDKLSRRQLSSSDMLVGQALALLYLHPSTVERRGLHTHEELIAQLATVLGTDALIRAFNPKRRRYDERVAQKTVRLRVGEAVRRLAGLGFVDLAEGDQLRVRPALLRFAEPVRGLSEPAEALAQLVARGEVALEGSGESAGAATDATDEAEDGEDEAATEDSAEDSDVADGDDAGGEPADEPAPAPALPAEPSNPRKGEPEDEFAGDTVLGHRRDVANPARGRKRRAVDSPEGGRAKPRAVHRGPSNAPDRGVTVQLFDLDDDEDEPDGDTATGHRRETSDAGGAPGGVDPGAGRKRTLTGPQPGVGPAVERGAPVPLFQVDDDDEDEADSDTSIGYRREVGESGRAPGGGDPGAGRKKTLTGPQSVVGPAVERGAPVPLFQVDDDDEDEADRNTAIGRRRDVAEPGHASGGGDPGAGRKKTLTGPQSVVGPAPLRFDLRDDDADEPNEVTEIGHRRAAEPAPDVGDDAEEFDGDTVLGYRRDIAGRPVPVGRAVPPVDDGDDDDGDPP
jgi:chromosome partition protein MukE